MPDPAATGPAGGDPGGASPTSADAALPQPLSKPPGPGGAPMLTPQKQEGKAASARIKVQVALHALMLAAREAGPLSEEGKTIVEVISKLIKQFGKSEDESKPMVPAEMRAILSQAQPAQMPGSVAQSVGGGGGGAPAPARAAA